ncbi:cystatin-B [Biomphalaria glabrata]|nr:cystatin-B-like [Biomphalaria glabrata]
MSKLCGAASDVSGANDEVHAIVKEIQSELESKANKSFPVFKAISFRSQVVAGTNFFVKIQVGDKEYLHARIFRPLPHTNKGPEVHSYLLNKSNEDKLEYF